MRTPSLRSSTKFTTPSKAASSRPKRYRGVGARQSCLDAHEIGDTVLQTLVCSFGASTIPHIYPWVLQALAGRGYAGCLGRVILGCGGAAMQNPGYELPRILIPHTLVNKAKKKSKGRAHAADARPCRWSYSTSMCSMPGIS